MSHSQATLIQRIRLSLGDMPWESTGYAADDVDVITVPDATEWAKGDLGEFDDGDTFWVRSSNLADNTLAATRSYYGSTGAAHALGTRVLKNPKYRYTEIVNAISSTIQGFLPWPRVYKVASDTITPAPSSTSWYDLASDAMGLISVYQLDANTRERKHYGQHHTYGRVEFERHLPTSLVASGIGLRFPDGFLDPSNTVYVTYAAKITDAVSAGNYTDFTDSNAIVEAIIFGTVALLQGTLELRKPRKAAQDTNTLQAASYFNRIYHSALSQAEKELRQNSPLMQTTSTA